MFMMQFLRLVPEFVIPGLEFKTMRSSPKVLTFFCFHRIALKPRKNKKMWLWMKVAGLPSKGSPATDTILWYLDLGLGSDWDYPIILGFVKNLHLVFVIRHQQFVITNSFPVVCFPLDTVYFNATGLILNPLNTSRISGWSLMLKINRLLIPAKTDAIRL